MAEKEIEEILEGSEEKEAPEKEETKSEEGEAIQEIEIDGKKYTLEQLKEALQAARDYQYLVPEFTRKSQRLAELERQLAELQKAQAKVEEDPAKAEAKRVLRELGFLTADELDQKIQEVREEIQLEKVCDYLEKKYDGSHGEPPFNRDEVFEYVLKNMADQERVDLEYAYKKLHEDFWGRMPIPEKKVVKTERGGGKTEFSLPPKKIKFEPTKEGEISVEEAARQLLEERERTLEE